MTIDIKNNNKYITHVIIRGQRVIPSNSFEIKGDKYLLLEILKSSDSGDVFLKIIGVSGINMGNLYFIPKEEFEKKTLKEIETSLEEYKH